MRVRSIVAILAVAGLAAASAHAAGSVNAQRLVLQRSDMPAGATRISFGGSQGAIRIPRTVRGQVAYVGWRFRNGRALEIVAAAAGIARNTRDAHDVFVQARRALLGQGTFARATLPRYGDEQFAATAGVGGVSGGVVFVRSGRRLWEVVVSGYPNFPRSRMLAELRKYAAKEKTRAAG
jgi:hypothetical protein